MILIGLTGSLATGKSTVSSILSSPPYSLPIIDADHLARAVTAPGTTGYTLIQRTFGPTTPDLLHHASPTSTSPQPLNRAVLGRLVFGPTPAQQRARARLNAIVHPLVRLAMLRSLLYYFIRGHWAVVLDIPLLYETGLDMYVSVVIMVSVSSPSVQMARLRARDTGLSEEEARDRVGSQMGIFEKKSNFQN
ncbi:dephospho-CoA kinase [Usnea florida]